jgi:hypothetical protein
MVTSESRNEEKYHNALKKNNCNTYKENLHNKDFKIYHQNIRGLSTKISESYTHLYRNFLNYSVLQNTI